MHECFMSKSFKPSFLAIRYRRHMPRDLQKVAGNKYPAIFNKINLHRFPVFPNNLKLMDLYSN